MCWAVVVVVVVVVARSYDRYWLLELLVPQLFDRNRCKATMLRLRWIAKVQP